MHNIYIYNILYAKQLSLIKNAYKINGFWFPKACSCNSCVPLLEILTLAFTSIYF